MGATPFVLVMFCDHAQTRIAERAKEVGYEPDQLTVLIQEGLRARYQDFPESRRHSKRICHQIVLPTRWWKRIQVIFSWHHHNQDEESSRRAEHYVMVTTVKIINDLARISRLTDRNKRKRKRSRKKVTQKKVSS